MNSTLSLHNTCRLTLTDSSGAIVQDIIKENITCDLGRTSLVKRLYDDTTSGLGKVQHIALGISTQTPNVSLSQLASENIRSAIDTTRTTISGQTVKVYATFGTGTALTVTEAGVFVDSTSTASPNTGSLLCYSTGWTSIVKPIDQTLSIEWTIILGNATV